MARIIITEVPTGFESLETRSKWKGIVIALRDDDVSQVAAALGKINQETGPFMVSAGDAFAALNKIGAFGAAADYMRDGYPEGILFGSGCAQRID